MKNWVVVAITAVVALGIGYSLRPTPPTPAPVVITTGVLPTKPVEAPAPEVAPGPTIPAYPKPEIVPPTPTLDEAVIGSPRPEPLVGNFPILPRSAPGGLNGPRGSIGPLEPDVPLELPTADLNADEARARRTILGRGGEIVASSDAKDSTGKVGRTLVVEIDSTAAAGLRSALRSALGGRVVLSDAGTVASTSPAFKKAEEELAEAKKNLDQARIDFLPQAPALRQLEEDYVALGRAIAEKRKAAGRIRLNILLRPSLGG